MLVTLIRFLSARALPILFVSTTAGALAGCTSVDGAVKKEGAKAKVNLAKIPAIAGDLATRAPVTADAVAPLAGHVLFDASYPNDTTASVVYAEDLAVPGELGNVYARIPGSKRVSECASLVEHGTFPWDPQSSTNWISSVDGAGVASILQSCTRIRTLFVLRTMDLVKPGNARINFSGDAGDASAADAAPVASTPADETSCRPGGGRCKFDGGYVKIEVHVFALDPLAHKGAFVIEAESSASVTLSGAYTSTYLETDLQTAISAAFRAALPKAIPGATVQVIP